MAKPNPQKDKIVSAALNHAASIRWTQRMQEYKRKQVRASPSFDCVTTASKGEGNGELRGYDSPPPLLDGPIYSAEYWRAWRSRSRAPACGGSKSGNKSRYGRARGNGNAAPANGVDKKCASVRPSAMRASCVASFRSLAHGTPTSSFAGGACGTQIFAAVSGGDHSDGSLLRAHHDAVMKSLLQGEGRPTAISSSGNGRHRMIFCPGVRMSHNNPRGETTSSSSKRSFGDGMYNIALADKVVKRATPSCFFKSGAASASETAIQGISRDTPGAIYKPNSCSASVPAISFSSADRFAVGHLKSETPGPGHYHSTTVWEGGPAGRGAVPWTGVETFMDSERSRPAPPPHLRPWQGFGNGCSVAEHIGYGACLDGRCCARHSVEQRNALRVVQFLGRERPGGGGKGQASRRRSLRCGDTSDDRMSDPQQNSHIGNGNYVRNSLVSALSPVDRDHAEDRAGEMESRFPSTDIEVGHTRRTAESKGKREASPRGAFTASSTLPEPAPQQASSTLNLGALRHQDNSTLRDFSMNDGTVDTSVVSSAVLGRESAGVAGFEEARAAGRKRTPLHFAAERGELSLVDRLCNQGDNKNAVDERGCTPLHDAADKGNTRVVTRLLQEDQRMASVSPGGGARNIAYKRPRQVAADPNVQDNKGRTPLYLACLRGHERAVRALLDAGACPDVVDIRGKPAQEVAGAQKIYQLLQFKTDVSLVKANIAALEEREQNAERQQRKAAQAKAMGELAGLKAEELRLRAAVDSLEKKRAAYATAAKSQG